MSEHLIIGGSQIFYTTATIMSLGAVVLLALSLRESGHVRKMLVLATLPAASMAVVYTSMGLGLLTVEVTAVGREQSITRFFGYTIVLGVFAYLEKDVIRLSWRQFGILYGVLLVTPWASLVSWVTRGSIESGMNVLAITAYLIGIYLLFGPLSREAQSESGERRLLFAKLRNIFVLGQGTLILQSAISEQSLGLTDFFVGQVGASYIDIILMFGIGGLAVSGKIVFEKTGTSQKNEQQAPAAEQQQTATAADS
jgi:sensory rhodopsin